jgi:hypothetical protein
VEGRWTFSDTNLSIAEKHRFHVDTPRCKLKRISHKQAMKCLRNRNVAIIGDSVNRFQSLNLMVLLIKKTLQDMPLKITAATPVDGPTARCANVSYFGYYDFAYAQLPLGWLPNDVPPDERYPGVSPHITGLLVLSCIA